LAGKYRARIAVVDKTLPLRSVFLEKQSHLYPTIETTGENDEEIYEVL
jgi:hypothetical protein